MTIPFLLPWKTAFLGALCSFRTFTNSLHRALCLARGCCHAPPTPGFPDLKHKTQSTLLLKAGKCHPSQDSHQPLSHTFFPFMCCFNPDAFIALSGLFLTWRTSFLRTAVSEMNVLICAWTKVKTDMKTSAQVLRALPVRDGTFLHTTLKNTILRH